MSGRRRHRGRGGSERGPNPGPDRSNWRTGRDGTHQGLVMTDQGCEWKGETDGNDRTLCVVFGLELSRKRASRSPFIKGFLRPSSL